MKVSRGKLNLKIYREGGINGPQSLFLNLKVGVVIIALWNPKHLEPTLVSLSIFISGYVCFNCPLTVIEI